MLPDVLTTRSVSVDHYAFTFLYFFCQLNTKVIE